MAGVIKDGDEQFTEESIFKSDGLLVLSSIGVSKQLDYIISDSRGSMSANVVMDQNYRWMTTSGDSSSPEEMSESC